MQFREYHYVLTFNKDHHQQILARDNADAVNMARELLIDFGGYIEPNSIYLYDTMDEVFIEVPL